MYYDRNSRPIRMSGIDIDITDRKEAEDGLRRSEERFRTSFDNLIDCFAIYTSVRDEKGQIIDFRTEFVNSAACRSNRMSREQQVGRGILELLPAHRESGLFDRYCRVVETGEPLEIEEMFYEDMFGDKRIGRVYAIRISKLGDGYVAAWRDITERKQTEERFQLATEAVCGLIYEWNTDSGRVERTAELFALTGFHPEEAEPTAGWWASRVHPEEIERVKQSHFASLSRGDSLHESEYRVMHRDGHYRHVWDRARAVYDEKGRPIRVVGFTIDVTARRRAEIALDRNESRLRRFADSDIIGVIFGDIYGGISYANDEYLRIIGYSREEFDSNQIGWSDVTPQEWLVVDERAIEQANTGNGVCTPYEKEYVRKDGTRTPVLVGFTLFGAGETVAFVLDISARKQVESQLKDADRRKDEFLAMLAHELRNPLAAISNSLQLFRTPGITDQDRSWAFDIADRQLQNLKRLIDDLLDVSRIRSGKIRLSSELLDASTIVARAVESMRPFIERRGHRLTVIVSPLAMPITGIRPASSRSWQTC